MSLPRLTEDQSHPNNIRNLLDTGIEIYVENGAAKIFYDKATSEYVYEPVHNEQLQQRRFQDWLTFLGFIMFAYCEYA